MRVWSRRNFPTTLTGCVQQHALTAPIRRSVTVNGAESARMAGLCQPQSGPLEWMVGLAATRSATVVPLSNYRVACVADLLAGPGACDGLHAAGAIEFPDAVAGATCSASTTTRRSSPATRSRPARPSGPAVATVNSSTKPGSLRGDQLRRLGHRPGHDGRHRRAHRQLRPDRGESAFKGWWQKNLPPHDLP